MTHEPPLKKRLRTAGVVAGVSAAHLVVFALIANSAAPTPFLPPTPPIDVILFRAPVPPPPPPPPPEPASESGGGAPAAPSRVHVPPEPPVDVPRELPAPVVQAPEPALVIGRAADAGPTPGMGQGGTGNGTGTGDGDGAGPGSGGKGALLIRRASSREIMAYAPRAARGRPGRASVNCVIRPDTTLDDCRLSSETPPGVGFGEAAMVVVPRYSRFSPPLTADGRPVEGKRVTVFIEFSYR